MVDVFEEVEEQLRSDQYKALARRALPWVIGVALAALAVTLAVWGWQAWRERQAAEASQAYAQALETLGTGDADKAFAAFGQIAEDAPAAYRAMALMQQAGIRLQDERTAEAVELFDAAAQAAPGPALGDLARLKSAFATLDTAPYSEIEKRLAPLTEDERPYRMHAKEALAFAKLMAGNMAEARTDFSVLAVAPEASDPMRERAIAARSIIDSGSAKAVPQAVKAAASLSAQPVPEQSGAAQ